MVKHPFVLSEASNFISRISAEFVRERNRFFTLNDILDSDRYALGNGDQIKAYHVARHNMVANLNFLRSARYDFLDSRTLAFCCLKNRDQIIPDLNPC